MKKNPTRRREIWESDESSESSEDEEQVQVVKTVRKLLQSLGHEDPLHEMARLSNCNGVPYELPHNVMSLRDDECMG